MLILSDPITFLLFGSYFFLIILSGISIVTNSAILDQLTSYFTTFTFLILIIFRTGFGVDEPTYLNAYRNFLSNGNYEFEYSTNSLFWLLKFFHISPDNFNTIIPILILLSAYISVRLVVKRPFRALVLIFTIFSFIYLDFSFNAYRQGLSIWFVLLSINSLIVKKRVSSIIFFTIGLGFHWSAIIVLLAALTSYFITMRLAVLMSFSAIFLTAIAIFIPLNIIGFFGTLLTFITFNSVYAQKIIFYLSVIKSSFYELNFFGRLPLIVTALTTMLLSYYYRNLIHPFYFKLITILACYCVLLLEMSYSFRNYYWLLPILPFLIYEIIAAAKNRNLMISRFIILSVWHFLLSILGFFSYPILSMILI